MSNGFGSHFGDGAGAETAVLGGALWMPPPPSTLYAGGKRPALPGRAVSGVEGAMDARPDDGDDADADADADAKGKGKARLDDDDDDVETTDPVDPREAIRQATLKRFGQAPSNAAAISTPASTLNATAPVQDTISMIPLFDPTSIPDFESAHAPDLPHPLLATPHLSSTTTPVDADLSAVLSAKTHAVQQQIALLSGIQTRIDGVIADLTRVLDVVGATNADVHQQQGSSQDDAAGASHVQSGSSG